MKLVVGKKAGLVFLAIFVVVFQTVSFMENMRGEDKYQKVADYIKKDLNPDDMIYAANYGQIIYYLTKTDSPTKYVHPSILSTDLYKVFNIDNKVEIRRILDKKPKYVVVKNKFQIVQDLLKKDYYLDHSFDNNVLLYKRVDVL